MNQFETVPFEEAFISVPVGKLKIRESEYNSTGSICVVDQGQNLVSGMTNHADLKREDGPYIVFGDHTRVVKFIDFPFVVGADGVRLYKASENYEPEFLYLFLKSSKLPKDGYGRHSKYLKEIFVPQISKKKQRQIAARLKNQLAEVEKARQAAERQLKDAEFLPSCIISNVFSKLNFPNKKLSEIALINPRRLAIERDDESLTSFIPMENVDSISGKIIRLNKEPYRKVKKGYTYFENSDVIFAKITPCMQNGKHAILHDMIDGFGFGSTEFHVIRPNKEVIPEWIHFFLRRKETLAEASKTFTGAVGQQRVPAGFLKNLLLPVPPIKKQRQITIKLKIQLSEVERLRQTAERQLKEIDLLPQKILAQAFEI